MMTGIAPAPCRSWMRRSISQPSTCGIITSSRIRSGVASSIAREALLGAAGLADGVALELEVHADELAHAGRRRRRAARAGPPRPAAGAGALEERVEVASAGSGGGRPACRTPARGRGPTTCGSCSGRRRGTCAAWPSVSQSGSLPGRLASSRAPSAGIYPKLPLCNSTSGQVVHGDGRPAPAAAASVLSCVRVVVEGLAESRSPAPEHDRGDERDEPASSRAPAGRATAPARAGALTAR